MLVCPQKRRENREGGSREPKLSAFDAGKSRDSFRYILVLWSLLRTKALHILDDTYMDEIAYRTPFLNRTP